MNRSFTRSSRLLLVVAFALVAGCGERGDEPSAKSSLLIASSPSHSCALRRAGLYCWGDNFAGQLGTGDTVSSEEPVQAAMVGSDIVELALGTGRTCVRRSTGQVACIGTNEQGQTGNGTRDEARNAVAVPEISDARAIALDDTTTCVLRAGGKVSCWGGSPESSPDQGSLTPKFIAGITGAVEVQSGLLGDYCARGEAGWVRCWTLSDGKWTQPVERPALQGAKGIAMTGVDVVCAILARGVIYCHNGENDVTSPLDSSEGTVELHGAGLLSACARNDQPSWHCWNVLPPMLESVGSPAIPITSEVPFVDLVLSGFRACALREDEQVACADANEGSFTLQPEFSVVTGLPP